MWPSLQPGSVWKSKGRKSREGSEVAVTRISAPGSSEGTAGTSLGLDSPKGDSTWAPQDFTIMKTQCFSPDC